jgi:integrase
MLALKAGVHPKAVQERLGHSSISVTMDIYSSVMRSVAREAAGVVSTELAKAVSKT